MNILLYFVLTIYIIQSCQAQVCSSEENCSNMSWIPVNADNHFPIQNIPFGIFSTAAAPNKRAGTAIGEFVVDLSELYSAGLFSDILDHNVFSEATLNSFMSFEKTVWTGVRNRLIALLSETSDDRRLRDNEALRAQAVLPMAQAQMHLPATVGDYTDFYSSREHATNVGIMFRGADNALQPNWLHLPVGYHGRSSSIVVSGVDVVRPSGQVAADKADPSKGSVFSPCRLMDFELEVGVFVGGAGNALGRPVKMAEAEAAIFGVVVLNDWSARDIQAWEYVPLGPFTAKNFQTNISPWIVTLDALEAFRATTSAGPVQENPSPLPYLHDPDYARSTYDVQLEVAIIPEGQTAPATISRSNMRYLYWNMKQQLVHHSITGCNMRAGDLLGSGTISGPDVASMGSMLEMSWRGARDIPLEAGDASYSETRKFLKDGDTVIMTGFAQGDGYRIGFGDCTSKVLPAVAFDF